MTSRLSIPRVNLNFSPNLESNESETASEPLIPILQSCLRNGKENEVKEQLNNDLQKKELEIERLCQRHYQEFIRSVDQLLEVRKGTVMLKERIVSLNDELQDSGDRLLANKTELIQHLRIQQNIETCIETLQTCLHILQLANRVNTLLTQKNYFSVLKTLDELEKEHLPHIQQYEFASYMAECIPGMRDLVKKEVILEKIDWLFKLKEQSRKSGQFQLQRMVENQRRWQQRELSSNQSTGSKSNEAPAEISTSLHLVKDELEGIEEISVMDELDFKPFYQCLHIHHKLGLFHEFVKSFEEERRQMAISLSEAPIQLGQPNLDDFLVHLYDVLGFFLVEQIILNTTTRFRFPSDVESLWLLITSKLVDDISRNLDVVALENLPKVKEYLLAFVRVGQEAGYDTRKLMQFVEALASYYKEKKRIEAMLKSHDME